MTVDETTAVVQRRSVEKLIEDKGGNSRASVNHKQVEGVQVYESMANAMQFDDVQAPLIQEPDEPQPHEHELEEGTVEQRDANFLSQDRVEEESATQELAAEAMEFNDLIPSTEEPDYPHRQAQESEVGALDGESAQIASAKGRFK